MSFSPFLVNLIDDQKVLSFVNENNPPSSCKHEGLSCDDIGWREVFDCKNNVNLYGYRSDQFKYKHDGKHILFSGCSYTWGSGLYKNEIWANLVYKKISSEEKCSGYFNLGIPGSCVTNQVYDIFFYCQKFGNPNVIFYCMPGTNRGFDPDSISSIKKFHFPPFHSAPEKDNESYNYKINYSEMINYLSYFSLYQYCKSNQIKLYSFSWEEVVVNDNIKNISPEERLLRMRSDLHPSRITQAIHGDGSNVFESFKKIKQFDSFYIWEREELIDFCNNFAKSYSGPHKNFLQISRDGNHLGIAPHNFWADFIYKKYKGDLDD